MQLEEYKKELEKHNWNYVTSKDPLEYDEGRFNHNRLLRLAGGIPELEKEFFKTKELYEGSVNKV